MPSKKIIAFLACCLSFVTGYLIKDNETNKAHKHTTKVENNIAEHINITFKKDTDNTKVNISSSPNLANENHISKALDDFLSEYQNASFFTIPIKSIAPLYLQLSQLDAQSLQNKIQELIHLWPNEASKFALELALVALAEKEPETAFHIVLDFSIPDKFKKTLAASVVKVWTANAPLEAYEWYTTLDMSQPSLQGTDTEIMISTAVLHGLYSYDKSLAISEISELSQQNKLYASSLSLVSRYLNNSEDFTNLLNALGANEKNTISKVNIVSKWFSKKPNDAVAWVDTLDEQQKTTRLLEKAFFSWAESAPLQASDWYINQFEGERKRNAIETAASNFAGYDPKAALDWVENLNITDNDDAIAEVLTRAAYHNPDFAMGNLDKINSEYQKLRVMELVVYSIHQEDPEKAKEIINSSPFKSDLENYAERMDLKLL